MKAEGMEKQEHILEAAIRRFSHFGIHKTTLTEVADDLSMSKQALFYYFSDKQSLIAAVEEKITAEYIESIKMGINGTHSVEAALLKLIEVKKEFFEKYFMLAEQFRNADLTMTNKSMVEVKNKLRASELELLAELIQKGIATGELKTLDAITTAGLLIDTLTAFTYCISDRKGLPDPKAFQELYQKQKAVLHLFYNGLKK